MSKLGLLSLLIFCTIIIVHFLIYFKCLKILRELKMQNVSITRVNRYLAKKQLREILKSPDYNEDIKQKAEDLLAFFNASVLMFLGGFGLIFVLYVLNGIFNLGLAK